MTTVTDLLIIDPGLHRGGDSGEEVAEILMTTLSVREGEDDFALFFGDFRNVLSVLLAPVSRFFACLQQTLKNTVA